ncbi:MAG: hypothetical protein QNJ72_41935 [Pleurocapsa sp. MO_226.B13]|nr:hypothetical protein [Pleurocapsa sp. MO_226.B13]
MKELIRQQQTLKRRKFAHNLALHIHSLILPMTGAFMMGLFYGINNTLALIGSGIMLYVLIIGMGLIIPYCNNRKYDLEKELTQLEDRLKHLEAINQSLDERRDMMLFDEDPDYWKILEELAG